MGICVWHNSRQWARASSFTRFLDHTQRRTTVGRTPLDEWSACRRDLYLMTHNTQKRQTSMSRLGFEPTIWAGEWPQTYTLDCAATETGSVMGIKFKNLKLYKWKCKVTRIRFVKWYLIPYKLPLSYIFVTYKISCIFYNISLIIHSFIPLPCAEFDDSLPFSGASSIPLCYVLFPATLPHQPLFHPLSPHRCHLFLGLPLNLVVPKFIYNTRLRNSISFHSLYMSKPT